MTSVVMSQSAKEEFKLCSERALICSERGHNLPKRNLNLNLITSSSV